MNSESSASRRRRTGTLGFLEALEGRRLLSSGHGTGSGHGPQVAEVDHHDNSKNDQNPEVIRDGKVVKAPKFYELYLQSLPAGATPRQDLNVIEASGRLEGNRGLVLTGKMNARIDLTKDSLFVWGIDRNGHLDAKSAPFPNRPDIRFDAVVVVQVKSGVITGTVRDLVTPSNVTTLPANAVRIDGDQVSAVVADPAHALPSTGLPLAQYRFNLWPRISTGAPSTVVSFAPEFSMAQVGHSDDNHGGN